MSTENDCDEPKIIVGDNDGGYIVATLRLIHLSPTHPAVFIYSQKEYYHDLASALRDEFGIKGEK